MILSGNFIDSLIRRKSRPLSWASRVLPAVERDGLRSLYAFFRITRDAVDLAGSRYEAELSVVLLQRILQYGSIHLTAAEQPTLDKAIAEVPNLGLAWEAWCAVEEEYEVPRAYAVEFARGLQMDAEGYRPETADALLQYAYRTGGVIGLMVCHILKVDASFQQTAVDAASGARIVRLAENILEDFSRGRIYLPIEWISSEKTRAYAAGWADPAAQRLMNYAETLNRSARTALLRMPFRYRLAFEVASILQHEHRSSFWRQLDRTLDVVIEVSAQAILKIFTGKAASRKLEKTVPANEASNHIRMAAGPLPLRDVDLAIRNQKLLLSRDLDKRDDNPAVLT